MTYCIGIASLIALTSLSLSFGRLSDYSHFLRDTAFFKLHYLVFGIIFSLIVPEGFASDVSSLLLPGLFFCLTWIGLYFGVNIERFSHRLYPGRKTLFHIVEPVMMFFALMAAGSIYVSITSRGAYMSETAILIATAATFTLSRRHPSDRAGAHMIHPVINDIPPVRNIVPIVIMCCVTYVLFGPIEVTVFQKPFSGLPTYLAGHILLGAGSGMLLGFAVRGSRSTDAFAGVFIGVTALTAGIANLLTLSPLLTGTLTGAFFINSSFDRVSVIEAVTLVNEIVERLFIMLLGFILVRIINPELSLLGGIILAVIGIVAVRTAVLFVIVYFWTRKAGYASKGWQLSWMGLTGQGILAAGAAAELILRAPSHRVLFIILIGVMVINQTITAGYIYKNR